MLINLIDFGMNLQGGRREATRIRHAGNGGANNPVGNIEVDSALPAEARAGLIARGHHLVDTGGDAFGGPGDSDRSENARADGRIGSEEGRARYRVLTLAMANG